MSGEEATTTSGAWTVAFDADGTIWEGDVGVDAFRRLVQLRDVRAEAAAALREEARRAGLEPVEDPNEQASALWDAFAVGKLPSQSAFPMMAWAFAGRAPHEMDGFASRLVRDGGLHSRVYAETLETASWCKANGIGVWVVSASPESVVHAALESIRFPVDRLVAMAPAVRDGVLQTAVEHPIPYAEGKVAVLSQLPPGTEVLAAFGDSAADLPMLSLARVPIAIRPSPGLVRDASRALPRLRELLVHGASGRP